MKLKNFVIHTHHIGTHFTNGLFPISSLFLTIFIFNNDPVYEASSYLCMVVGTLGLPVVYFSGIYDWKTRFKGRRTMIFDHKSILGLLLLILGVIAVLFRLTNSDIMFVSGGLKYFFLALNYALTGLVGYLGYLGGKFI